MQWLHSENTESLEGLSAEALSTEFHMPFWLAKILRHRMNFWSNQSLDAVKKFLEPNLKYLPDPFLLPDMDRATERVVEAICNQEAIAIYGDYDVDGTVGAALLRRFFRMLGVEPIVYQPDRAREGYGLNLGAIEKLKEQGAQLIITVDCGISNRKEVARANELGVDVIICDHHEVPDAGMPEAYAVLDHKRKDNEGPIFSLCGAGVAFYLCMGVRAVLRDIDYFSHEGAGKKEPDLRNLLDLVAVATLADMVPLVEENRILVVYGMEKLRKAPCAGLLELCKVAGVNPADISPYHIGFVIGPRINASGRLGTANAALELLSTDDPNEAQALAGKLDGMNSERMDVQAEVAEQALKQAEEMMERARVGGEELSALVLAGETWHEGVIGIVASRVVEKYHRPVVVITFATHTGLGKGSTRSVGKLNVLSALEQSAEYLVGFGGHKAAAGLSLKKEDLENFRKKFSKSIAEQVAVLCHSGASVLERELNIDAILNENDTMNFEMVSKLEKLAPFGIGNSEPVLAVQGWKLVGGRTIKERHLKVQLSLNSSINLEGFWPNGAEKFRPQAQQKVDIAFYPQISVFRGQKKIELRIRDIRASSN